MMMMFQKGLSKGARGHSGTQENSFLLGSFARQFLRLRHLALSHANWTCIFKFLRSVL